MRKQFRLAMAAMVLLVAALSGRADQPDQPDKKTQPLTLKELTKLAADVRLTSPVRQTERFELKDAPLLHWTNPLRTAPAGATFLWTGGNRPQAVACLYELRTDGVRALHLELHSLAAGPLNGEFGELVKWRPERAGIEFKPVPKTEPPANSERVRQSQIRRIARRFSARMLRLNEEEGFELRLLSRPLHDYSSKSQSGALFAFAQGTDPEVLLLIESRSADDAAKKTPAASHFALARMTIGALRVRLDERQVWAADEIDGARVNNPARPYAVFWQDLPGRP